MREGGREMKRKNRVSAQHLGFCSKGSAGSPFFQQIQNRRRASFVRFPAGKTKRPSSLFLSLCPVVWRPSKALLLSSGPILGHHPRHNELNDPRLEAPGRGPYGRRGSKRPIKVTPPPFPHIVEHKPSARHSTGGKLTMFASVVIRFPPRGWDLFCVNRLPPRV